MAKLNQYTDQGTTTIHDLINESASLNGQCQQKYTERNNM